MLDYHLHLWPHAEHETPLRLEQLAEYCARAQAAGVTELAVTEHLFRFRQADALVGGFWNDERVPPALAENMAQYYAFHSDSLPGGRNIPAGHVLARLVTSFATNEADIEAFASHAKRTRSRPSFA